MRRSVVLAVTAAVLWTALPAAAEDLGSYLERSARAEFTGEQVITCDTPDGVRDAVVEVAQADGTLAVRSTIGDGPAVRAGSGVLAVVDEDGRLDGAKLERVGAVPVDRYRGEPVGVLELLGRSAEEVSVHDPAGSERARMAFDVVTGALLRSEVLNGDGSVYCRSRLVEFTAGASVTAVPAEEVRRLEPVEDVDGGVMPGELGGFDRVDAYAWGEEGVLAYYSDGFFSFTLLHTPGPVRLDAAGAVTVPAGRGSYTRWFGPGHVLYAWETALGGLALFGDLPLDLQDTVLDELPPPQDSGLLTRWWRRLFG